MSEQSSKQQMIIDYIRNTSEQLNMQYSGIINKDRYEQAVEMFKDSKLPYEEVVNQINALAEQMIKNYLEEREKSPNKFVINNDTLGQNFNYHTHTYRSGHSEYVSDEEMLQAVKNAGILMVGFSEHIPNPDLTLPDEEHRMLSSEVDDYIASINKMKQEHPEMTILAGFEAEYDPMKEAFLGEMRDKVDYMILGEHFVNRELQIIPSKNNPNYPIEYANMVSKAIDSGIFDIIAHPDYFMKFRDTIESDEAKELFDENAVLASQIICEKARDMGIPIEINLSKAISGKALSDGNLPYPHPTFWKVAKEIEGLKVLKGIDAHNLDAFKNIPKAVQQIKNIEQIVSDKMIRGTYNPVIARQNNPKLQQAYVKGQANALTFETHMINKIINDSLSRTQEGLDSESIAAIIGTSLNSVMQSCIDNASKKDQSIIEEMTKVGNSSLPLSKLKRKKMAIKESNQVLSNQQRAIEIAKESTLNAMNIGCGTKHEYSNMITQITQHKTTKNNSQKEQIERHIESFSKSKGITNTSDIAYQLTRTNLNQNNNNTGSANILILALVIAFITGFGIGIGYMIFRFTLGG